MVNGGIFLALGLLFLCSAVISIWQGEIYALRPSTGISAADQPDAFQRRVLTQLALGALCATGGAGYLWMHRSRS